MPEKILLAATITFALNLFLGGNWSPSTPVSEKAQLPDTSRLANTLEAQETLPFGFIKPPML
ncbi:MAG TPA: hypothetical protein V6C63_05770 [Allocoleopsis sp.]